AARRLRVPAEQPEARVHVVAELHVPPRRLPRVRRVARRAGDGRLEPAVRAARAGAHLLPPGRSRDAHQQREHPERRSAVRHRPPPWQSVHSTPSGRYRTIVAPSGRGSLRWQAAHATRRCAPASGKRVRAWSKDATRNVSVTWHAAQSAPSNWPPCGSSVRWHEPHAAPRASAWSNSRTRNVSVTWHDAQDCAPKRPLCGSSARWHATHSRSGGRSVSEAPRGPVWTWQAPHGVATCAPVSGNAVRSCRAMSYVTGVQPRSVWQPSHATPAREPRSSPRWWSTWHAEQSTAAGRGNVARSLPGAKRIPMVAVRGAGLPWQPAQSTAA